ncbi:uncharacterized protein LOC128085046 isoform X2 [Tympanuchus pallidicinctus]|uniref:uncharacterized protein LOC128085046 isoform X2 n=1 Tax=Tympanuchus pallidicinctus TaxID=109042 RepID=UPI0022872142|nr:uncharacterized protein LOC128085046 isoform X2 [Tympanuchus pallidicinctus]
MPRKRIFLSPSFLPKDEVPECVLADLAEQIEEQERQFLHAHFPPLRTSDLDLLAEEGTTVSVPPHSGKSWAERYREMKEREGEVRLPPLRSPLGTSLARKQFRAPQVQQRFPHLKTTTQEREKAQKEKISSKKKSEEISCRLPPVAKGRTVVPPAEMAEPNFQTLRAKQVLGTLESYKVCREGWRKKVEQNWFLPARPMEYVSFVKKLELQEARQKRKNL